MDPSNHPEHPAAPADAPVVEDAPPQPAAPNPGQHAQPATGGFTPVNPWALPADHPSPHVHFGNLVGLGVHPNVAQITRDIVNGLVPVINDRQYPDMPAFGWAQVVLALASVLDRAVPIFAVGPAPVVPGDLRTVSVRSGTLLQDSDRDFFSPMEKAFLGALVPDGVIQALRVQDPVHGATPAAGTPPGPREAD